jgi:hypothetical protein
VQPLFCAAADGVSKAGVPPSGHQFRRLLLLLPSLACRMTAGLPDRVCGSTGRKQQRSGLGLPATMREAAAVASAPMAAHMQTRHRCC